VCKKINAFDFLAPTTFVAQYYLPRVFRRELANLVARSVCSNWATCCYLTYP